MSELVRIPKDRFSHDTAQISLVMPTGKASQDRSRPFLPHSRLILSGLFVVEAAATCVQDIMLTYPCNLDPLTPHFCNVKLGFTVVYIIFLFLL